MVGFIFSDSYSEHIPTFLIQKFWHFPLLHIVILFLLGLHPFLIFNNYLINFVPKPNFVLKLILPTMTSSFRDNLFDFHDVNNINLILLIKFLYLNVILKTYTDRLRRDY